MKPIITLIVALQLCLNSTAQKEIPSFGKVDKADLEMKVCSFDENAEAVVLFDVGEVYCDLNLESLSTPIHTQLERHVRIKILNKNGVDRANIRIRYFSFHNLEDIKNLSAQTINLDAAGNTVITKVDKDAIFRKKINKRYSEVIFTFPDVKAGSIIEYKYKDDATGFNALEKWYFQKSIPVLFSRYILNFPNEVEVSAVPQTVLQVVKNETLRSNRNIKTFTMTNVPALRNEAFITCSEDYLQQVTPLMLAYNLPTMPRQSLLRTWPGIVKQLMEDEDFGVQLKKNIPRTSDLDALLAPVTDRYKKMELIHRYVKKNMEWDGTLGIWAMDGVKSAWKSKKGTAGEINLILVNLLKDADLEAYPVLVSTRENGRINTRMPGFDQFDKVMSYVKINGKAYVLDATDQYTPSNMVPYEVLNSEGLVIEKLDTYQWGWRTLWNEEKLFDNDTFINAEIDGNGNMHGTADITSSDYCRLQRMEKLKEGVDQFTEAWLNQKKDNITIDSLQFSNRDIDSLPLLQQLKFSKKISTSGDYNYFSMNLFSSLDKNPFIADERFSDVFYGANQRYSIVGNCTIPEGFKFDALPKNVKMIMPDTSIVFSRSASTNGNMLFVKIVLEFKQPFYLNENYDYFKEFYKKLFDFLNEQFVYKKA